MGKKLHAMQETWVQSLGWEDILQKGMANDQIANICWIIKKAREVQKKTSTSVY